MSWIVLGEKSGKIALVSKTVENNGILPKGSYLTIESDKQKFILRVDDSRQTEPYSPDPAIIDKDLSPLRADQKCQNIIYAYRVLDLNTRSDGLVDFIKPQMVARRSTQEEINLAMGTEGKGPKVFISTIYSGQNQILIDDNENYITANLPEDMFFHQLLVCGKTGSGKTVATKYLAQYFVEEMGGAVLAINVKEADFLLMDKESSTKNESILNEWKNLNSEPHKVETFTIYYPSGVSVPTNRGINEELCTEITLDVKTLDPESFVGLLQGITDSAAQSLPNIFRYWQETNKNSEEFSFRTFVEYFKRAEDNQLEFRTMNLRLEESETKMHRATFNSILRKLDSVSHFFDNEDAKILDESDILQAGKMSVIDVSSKNGTTFGSVLLRDLLNKIVLAKAEQRYKVPVLIIIDEVHMFYNSNASADALGDLDTICRTGRSSKIGVIFSSQNPTDIPTGLSSVINTKIFFKTDYMSAKGFGIQVSGSELESLKKGYAIGSIFELSQLKLMKFPLAFSGVFDGGQKNE